MIVRLEPGKAPPPPSPLPPGRHHWPLDEAMGWYCRARRNGGGSRWGPAPTGHGRWRDRTARHPRCSTRPGTRHPARPPAVLQTGGDPGRLSGGYQAAFSGGGHGRWRDRTARHPRCSTPSPACSGVGCGRARADHRQGAPAQEPGIRRARPLSYRLEVTPVAYPEGIRLRRAGRVEGGLPHRSRRSRMHWSGRRKSRAARPRYWAWLPRHREHPPRNPASGAPARCPTDWR
jgi:hypothetical protein